jgi:hypothetical protein
VSNPAKFVAAGYTNRDKTLLRQRKVSLITQVCKLETTKATIARQVLKSFEVSGDERSYYEAVKTFELQQAKGRVFDAFRMIFDKRSTLYNRMLSATSCIFWSVEGIILWTIGLITGWGASVLRPLLISLVLYIIFAIAYKYTSFPSLTIDPYQRALDISLLAGYSNYHLETDYRTVVVQNFQLIAFCLMYSLSFASILSRFSRVR